MAGGADRYTALVRVLLDPGRWTDAALPARWSSAQPFPHLVIDDFLDEETLSALRGAVAAEPHFPEQDEIVECMASAAELRHPVLRAFVDRLGGAQERAALHALTGQRTGRLSLRSYVYLEGGYLLPHTDHRPGVDRQVAFVLYLSQSEGWQGGELDLYRCRLEGRRIVATTVDKTIEPRPNRLVLLQVSERSLHRVREVTAGARISLAGWFS